MGLDMGSDVSLLRIKRCILCENLRISEQFILYLYSKVNCKWQAFESVYEIENGIILRLGIFPK